MLGVRHHDHTAPEIDESDAEPEQPQGRCLTGNSFYLQLQEQGEQMENAFMERQTNPFVTFSATSSHGIDFGAEFDFEMDYGADFENVLSAGETQQPAFR